jgi:hypothetical protein
MVRLSVNDDGHAEWSLLGGSHPRTTVIDTEVDWQEQEEERQRERARVTADARVDWSRVVDVNRQPALAYVDAGICGHGVAYGWSGDRTEAITVRAGKALSGLAAAARTFDLADGSSGFDVRLHLAAQPLRSWPFCSDVRGPGEVEETWRATKGSVTIEVSPRGAGGRLARYRATIRLVGAEFVNGAGARVTQVQPISLTVMGVTQR